MSPYSIWKEYGESLSLSPKVIIPLLIENDLLTYELTNKGKLECKIENKEQARNIVLHYYIRPWYSQWAYSLKAARAYRKLTTLNL